MDHELLGWVFVGAGFADLIVSYAVLRPRLTEAERRVVGPVLTASAGLLVGLGGSFLGGVI